MHSIHCIPNLPRFTLITHRALVTRTGANSVIEYDYNWFIYWRKGTAEITNKQHQSSLPFDIIRMNMGFTWRFLFCFCYLEFTETRSFFFVLCVCVCVIIAVGLINTETNGRKTKEFVIGRGEDVHIPAQRTKWKVCFWAGLSAPRLLVEYQNSAQ